MFGQGEVEPAAAPLGIERDTSFRTYDVIDVPDLDVRRIEAFGPVKLPRDVTPAVTREARPRNRVAAQARDAPRVLGPDADLAIPWAPMSHGLAVPARDDRRTTRGQRRRRIDGEPGRA